MVTSSRRAASRSQAAALVLAEAELGVCVDLARDLRKPRRIGIDVRIEDLIARSAMARI